MSSNGRSILGDSTIPRNNNYTTKTKIKVTPILFFSSNAFTTILCENKDWAQSEISWKFFELVLLIGEICKRIMQKARNYPYFLHPFDFENNGAHKYLSIKKK